MLIQDYTGRLRYDPVSMLKTVLFGFMANGYISLRELEDQCKINLRFMYLMDHQAPSYRTFGYFINEVLADSIEEIFQDINKKIFETEHVDLQHLYIDGSKFEANANKYSWVWKKATEKSRYRLFGKITTLFEEINEELSCTGMKLCINSEYAPEYLKEAAEQYAEVWQINEAMFVHGRGHRKTTQQRYYEKLKEYAAKLEEYVEKSKSVEKIATATRKQIIQPLLCESRQTTWEMTSCFQLIMYRSVLQMNILLLLM